MTTMKKYLVFLLVLVLFCALTAGGCGGGSDGDISRDDSGSTEYFGDEGRDDTGSDIGTDTGDEGRGVSASTVDLSTLTGNYTAQDGETLTGKLGANVKISVADGATITIRDVTINGVDDVNCQFAGLSCLGDAAIILAGTNTIKGFHNLHPGIHVPQGKTLAIKGDGALTASANGMASGIGGGWDISCGNIVIDGETITAAGGYDSAGIGTGLYGSCGQITINDGKITAVKGSGAAFSVGPGYNYNGFDITVCGLKYSATEGIFTYGLEPNTKGKFTVNIDVAGAYNTKSIAFYGRKSLGLNDDGSYKLGGWEKLKGWTGSWDTHTGDQSFEVLRKYVELGFEFDIASGTDWPYSGVFWTAGKTLDEQVDSVFIDFGGTVRSANIQIKVNGREVFSGTDCDSHKQYSW